MTELLTAAQMRAIEEAAIASGDVTGLELMERAGRGVVEAIFEEWPELAPPWGPAPKPPEYLLQDDEKGLHRAVVLCGPGNNGGDGFVVARLLKEAGWDVDVFLYGDAAKLPPDARVNCERWQELGEVRGLSTVWIEDTDEPHVLIDALFGTGLTRPLGEELVDALWGLLDFGPGWAKRLSSNAFMRRVSLDVPSGLCADSGLALYPNDVDHDAAHPRRWPRTMAYSFRADFTVSFHQAKLAHYLAMGPSFCGKVHVARLPKLRFSESAQFSQEVNGDHATKLIEPKQYGVALKPRMVFHDLPKRQGHKYSHGHALILSGGVGKGGAARLAARGALRIGAGAVTVGAPPAALIENAAQLNAIMLQRVPDADGLAAVLADDRINALCLGPGLGIGARESALVAAALQGARPGLDPGPRGGGRGPGSGLGRGVVLDADALTLLSQDSDLFAALHKNCVLTPHAGEFARLFPDIAEKLNAPATKGPAYSKVDATREAAARAGCIVLFKGPDTVIADPSGRCSINASVYERAAPWLATAGSGDVLAGFITGLLSRGYGPMQAAETGAWLHTECALSFGPGLIAEDLPEELPKVLRNMGL